MAISGRFLWLVLCVTFTLLARVPASAAPGFPARADPSINDLAGLLAPADERVVRETLERLRREQGIDAVLVTLPSITDYGGTNQDIEGFARRLFDHWGIDDAATNDGVLILLALEERAIRIELGAHYGSRYDTRMAEIIQTWVVPHLRVGDYSGGLREAVAGVATALANPPTASSLTGFPTTRERAFSEVVLLVLVLTSAFLYVLVSFWSPLRDWLRNRPRPCERCRTRMIRLTGDSALAHLDVGQRKELELRSELFHVWSCGACGDVQVLKYRADNQSYKPCPRCGYRTLGVQLVLRAPTKDRAGPGRLKEVCRHCGLQQERTDSFAGLNSDNDHDGYTAHDRSSSAASGGGSSGGGGATGRW